MNESLGSFKSFEDVHLKATYNMVVNGINFEEGETIALFDKISISGLNEARSYIAARGGFDNRGLVYWEQTRDVSLSFSQGVFSRTQFGLLTNSNVIKVEEEEPILVTKVEAVESDEAGNVVLEHEPVDQIFVYDKETGEKVDWFKLGTNLRVDNGYQDLVVYYRYNYTGGGSIAKIGQRFLTGFVSLEGKTRVKDDTSGLVTTGIIRIPKLKLMSGLSIRLGAQANPVVGNFAAVCVPVESRHSSYVMEFDFLNNDIDSDM